MHIYSNADDVPLIKNEILSEPHITSQNLCTEPILGMQFENEPETWSPSVPKEIVKSLTAKQVNFLCFSLIVFIHL